MMEMMVIMRRSSRRTKWINGWMDDQWIAGGWVNGWMNE